MVPMKLKDNIKVYDSDSPKSALINGDCVLGAIWSAEIALAQRENPAIQIVFPKEGAEISTDNWVIPTNAKNVDNAMKFLDYMADFVIVGAGVIGCATAYNLALRGHSVIVLEKDESIGNGGSSRNGGGVRQSGRDARELPLAMYAVENIWPGLSDELGADVEYVKRGNLRLGKTEHHLEILQGLARTGVEHGLDMPSEDVPFPSGPR